MKNGYADLPYLLLELLVEKKLFFAVGETNRGCLKSNTNPDT